MTLTQYPGYKQYKTNRKYMARMGNWRDNKDDEIKLDGIGGVNIMVKADVHRSGTCYLASKFKISRANNDPRYQLPSIRIRESSRDGRLRKDGQASRIWSVRSTKLRCLAYRYRRETWKWLRSLHTFGLRCLDYLHVYERGIRTRTEAARF